MQSLSHESSSAQTRLSPVDLKNKYTQNDMLGLMAASTALARMGENVLDWGPAPTDYRAHTSTAMHVVSMCAMLPSLGVIESRFWPAGPNFCSIVSSVGMVQQVMQRAPHLKKVVSGTSLKQGEQAGSQLPQCMAKRHSRVHLLFLTHPEK